MDFFPPKGADSKSQSESPLFLKEKVETGIQTFDQLNISTITTMTYSNFNIDTKNLFHLLPITLNTSKIESEILKKKDIDKIKLQYAYGEIINISTKSCFRGLLLRRPKKKNCTICNPTKNKKVKKSIIEIFEESENSITLPNNKIIKIPITKIMYKCSGCEKTYNPTDVKKINHFLNQMSIVMSLGVGKTPINIKIFHNGKFTITGCTEQDDAIEVMIILFKDLIPKLEKAYEVGLTTKKPGDGNDKRFIFDTVMRNYDFKLGFILNRSVLNNIMSNPEYDSMIKLSKYIPTDDTNVKIKMLAPKTNNKPLFDCLIIDDSSELRLEELEQNPYDKPKKKVKEELDTFIVFSSSATIFSGRNIKSMEYNYNIFIDIIKKYKNEIEEKK